MSTNFVGNKLTQSEAIETYRPYDVTSSRPRKTTIAFFANFGGIKKLFCASDQSLNSKIMNQCSIDFNFLEQKRGYKFHFVGTLRTFLLICRSIIVTANFVKKAFYKNNAPVVYLFVLHRLPEKCTKICNACRTIVLRRFRCRCGLCKISAVVVYKKSQVH